MKKLLSLMLLGAASLCASASNFTLYFGDTPVTDGGVYSTGYTLSTAEEDGTTIYHYVQNSDLYLQGAKGTPVTVTVKTNGKSVGVCSLNGVCENCMKSNDFTVVKTGYLTGEMQDLEIHREYNKFNTTSLPKFDEIELDVTVESGSESVHVTVNLTSEKAGVDTIVGEPAEYVNLVGDTLYFKTPEHRQLIVYNENGATEFTAKIKGNGSLNMSHLPKGIYIVRLGAHTSKILLK